MSDRELERLLAERDEIDRQVASRQRDLAVLFTDICGSTELFERRGDVEGVAFIHRHNRLLFPLVEEHGGRIVKTIGDAIMAVFEDPAGAVRCGAKMQLRLVEARREDQGEPIHIKVGVHFGKVVQDGEDVFGDAVNTAARIQGKAVKDEVLLSQELHSRLADAIGYDALPRGAVSLKGKAEPVPVTSLRWGPEAPPVPEPGGPADESSAAPPKGTVPQPSAAPELFVLEIARTQSGLKVAALDGPADKGPVKSYAEVPLSAAELEAMAGRMAAFLGGSAGSYADRLATEGRSLFETALSGRARQRLKETPRTFLRLHVDDSVAHVPWELMHDGEKHLCLRFACGRVVSARDDGELQSLSAGTALSSHALVVSNPTGDLPGSAREGEAVAGLLSEGFGGKVHHLTGPVGREAFLEALEGARMLHFAGHVARRSDPDSYGFRLMGGCVSPEEAAQRLGSSPTDLVFANACNANDTAGWTDAARGTFDLASTLLMRGVRHYLGPVGAIGDFDALTFSLRFYEEVLGGVAFGEAARRARESLFHKSRTPLSFARYVLYGEPRTVLPRDVAVLPERGPTRADPMMPPGAVVSDGIPFPPPATAWPRPPAEAWNPTGVKERESSKDPAIKALVVRNRKGIATAAFVGLCIVGGAAFGKSVGLFFASEGAEVAPIETTAPPSVEGERPPSVRTGDIRMTVLELRPMGGTMDPHLSQRLGNTLNYALVGVPGIAVAERADFDQVVGTEAADGELRRQFQMSINDQPAFDSQFRSEIGRLQGLEVAIVGGFQEAAGRLRIVANFVEVETGVVIEAVRVEGQAGDEYVMDLQDHLTERVVEALPRVRERLRPQLLPDEAN